MPVRFGIAPLWVALMVLLLAARPVVVQPAAPPEAAVAIASAAMHGATHGTTDGTTDGTTNEGALVTPERVAPELVAPGEGATIAEVDYAPLASDLRAAERVELLSALARILVAGPGSLLAGASQSGPALVPPSRVPATWSDVVQCRRQRGVQLLRYATAPPPVPESVRPRPRG